MVAHRASCAAALRVRPSAIRPRQAAPRDRRRAERDVVEIGALDAGAGRTRARSGQRSAAAGRDDGRLERSRRDVRAKRDFEAALAGVTLIEAANERDEALAIAVALRGAIVEPKGTAALVTTDRELARRVSAELLRFGIRADDSGGTPLARTPPGELLRCCSKRPVGRAIRCRSRRC